MSGPTTDYNPNTTAVSTLLNLVQAVNALNQTMNRVFPQTIGVASSATGGAATLPANPVGFLSLVNPVTGDTVEVPYYSP